MIKEMLINKAGNLLDLVKCLGIWFMFLNMYFSHAGLSQIWVSCITHCVTVCIVRTQYLGRG